MSKERDRLADDREQWLAWGPYVSDRAWGTVREDYSADGTSWDYFPHDHARSRAYRWNEDGLAGLCDAEQRLCFALALWNGRDPILKERLFGLSGPEGNHGEDVKEYWFHLDSTPTHSYLRMLYKYPQAAFPYADLVDTNRRRSKAEPEYELVDTGVFAGDRYFDVFVEYAKASPDDVAIRWRIENRGPDAATLHVLPTLWFRNTWTWSNPPEGVRPELRRSPLAEHAILAEHATLGTFQLLFAAAEVTRLDGTSVASVEPRLLFTENETNVERLFGAPSASRWVKDAFHRAVVEGEAEAVNPSERGTKAAAHYALTIPGGGAAVLRMRLARHAGSASPAPADLLAEVDGAVEARLADADEFYGELQPASLDEDERRVQRQAFAGLLWSKQFYHYDVRRWLQGDPTQPPPPASRERGRNHDWIHFGAADIISMPDKWEYPWFAAWDLSFHCIPLALVDPGFAKQQLVLLGREWYQHPNGEIPAYEWAFGDVNPPLLAWAAWHVYQLDRKRSGQADRAFLERVFHKAMLTFTWWVNRKDRAGNSIFEGGFLGMDNVGVFDRSAPLPTGGFIDQSDATAWVAMFALTLLEIALELAIDDPVYEDIATKFFEHFIYIVGSMNHVANLGIDMWDPTDEFYYDFLQVDDAQPIPLRTRSMVGLVPLFAVATIEPETIDRLPDFRKRLEWFLQHRPRLANLVSRWYEPGLGERRLLAIMRGHRIKCVLRRMLDPAEFLSPHGLRSLSRFHAEHPFVFESGGVRSEVAYEPGESRTGTFGGNSNWRGPVWMPVNYLAIAALRRFHLYFSDDFRVESPTGSGTEKSLDHIADDLSMRLVGIFLRDAQGRRPVFGACELFQSDPHWRDYLPFHEYFHGDDGHGLGASHQTGWTALVASRLQEIGERRDAADAARAK